MIYLDNAATTFPKPQAVYEEMDCVNRECGVNAGRGSYKLARKAADIISNLKNEIRSLVKTDVSSAVVLTPSITVALNQIIFGVEWKQSGTVYVSPYEHNAVARTLYQISKRNNIDIQELPMDEDTLEIDIEKMKYVFSKNNPIAVFCTHMSNVTGYILPIQEIFEASKKYNALTVLDTAQSLGLLDVDSQKINADLIAFAGHKSLYGPLGIGGFINIGAVDLKEVIVGGTGSDSLNLDMPQNKEQRYEAASSNVIAVAGLKKAIEIIDRDELYKKEKALTDYLVDRLSKLDGITLYVPSNREKHIGVVSFSVENYLAEDVGLILDEDYDIAVRTGYHCAPYIHKYLKDQNTLGTVRVGLGQFNSQKDIDALVDALSELCG